MGWGWTLQESGMSGNRIEANYVHHFARRLYDAGGLYTLSNQPGSVMRNNRIEHLIDAPYATNDRAFYIYFDEATLPAFCFILSYTCGPFFFHT